MIWDVLRSSQISINACVKVGVKSVTGRDKKEKPTYVEVVDAAGGSPKSVITQSRAVSAFSGPFTGISCRPCK